MLPNFGVIAFFPMMCTCVWYPLPGMLAVLCGISLLSDSCVFVFLPFLYIVGSREDRDGGF